MSNSQISAIIRGSRAILGWSQDKLAAEIGLAVTSIARIEQGKVGLRLKTYDKLISALKDNGITIIRSFKTFTLTVDLQNDSSDLPE
jgi:predicted transcriptional regulator